MNNKEKRIIFIFVEGILLLLVINNFKNIKTIEAVIINIVILFFMFLFYWLIYNNKINNKFGNYFMSNRLNKSIETNIDYFREIINNYSIGELCFLDGYDIDYPKDIVAIILKLKLKKIIDIVDNKIIIINNNTNLKDSEKYILNSIQDGNIVLEEDLSLKKIVKEELIKDKIILKKENNSSFINKILIFATIIFIVLLLSFLIVPKLGINFNSEEDFMKIIIIIFFAIGIMFVIISVIESIGSNYAIKLSENGKEIKARLNGLKKYLQHFSVIDKRKVEELFLYEDYLIYSVMFDINKDIINKYKNLIIIKEELYIEEK